MENIYFIGERNCRDEFNKMLKMKYFLVEDYENSKVNKPVYSIEVIKLDKSTRKDTFEKETTPSISFSKAFVMQIIHRIMDNLVTPATVLEIVDDMITEEINCKEEAYEQRANNERK